MLVSASCIRFLPEISFIVAVLVFPPLETIAVRQRDACSFLNYYEVDGSISLKNFLTVKNSEYPFVTIDNCSTEFCTINANRTVQLWRPEHSR